LVHLAPSLTDNGVMVAWAGAERLRRGLLDDPHTARHCPPPTAAPPIREELKEEVLLTLPLSLWWVWWWVCHLHRFHPRWPLDRTNALMTSQIFPGHAYKRPHKSTLYDP
jgi:hypothetical protein